MLPTILPRPSQQDAQGNDPGADPPVFKRKRALVALACAACRKRKTKCDGRRPTCLPCEQRTIKCIFDFPDDVPAARRGKRTIDELSKMNLDLSNVITALRSGTEEHALTIVREIRANDNLQQQISSFGSSSTVSLRVTTSNQILSESDKFTQRSLTDPGFTETRLPSAGLDVETRSIITTSTEENVIGRQAVRYSLQIQSPHGIIDVLPISAWTRVPGEDRLFSELLMLLWTWDTTFVRVVDREAFEADLRAGAVDDQRESSKRQFCSVFLVNALLGFACTFAVDENMFEGGAEDLLSRGRLFVEEAEEQVARKMKDPSFDLLQGLTILYAYEARTGNGKAAKEYLEKVFYVYKCLDFDEDEVNQEIEASDLEAEQVRRAKSKILWGLYMFEWKLSHTYGQRKRLSKPEVAKIWQSTPSQPDQPDYWWCPWPKSLVLKRCYYQEVFDAECSLIEIAEDILSFVYPNQADQKEAIAAQHQALQLYDRLTQWKLAFSDAIPEEASEFPQSLHVCYCYEMMVVTVLRKVVHLTKEEFGTTTDPQALCYAHTNNIMSILWTYRALYTIRNESWAAQACSLVAFSTVFNLDSNTVIRDSFEKVCRVLYEISEVYSMALDFLFSIRVTVQKNGIRVGKISSKYLSMAKGPQQLELTTEWRALILLGKTDGVRGGNVDIALGDLIQGFAGLVIPEEE